MPTYDVFLSHHPDDLPHVEDVAQRLQEEDVTVFLDDWDVIPGRPLQESLEAGLSASRTCAVFVGPQGLGPWHQMEMRAALQSHTVEDDDFYVIPVLLPDAGRPEDLPKFLRLFAWVDLAQPDGYRRLFAGIRGEAPGPGKGGTRAKAPAVTIARLPVPGLHFLGRDAELERLDQAWDDATRVFVLVAFGGVGKSALVYKWLEALAADAWRDAERVLGWSFYSQGTDATAANADAFVDFALRWLKNDEDVPGSPWERGVLLARLVRARRTLLVLDGLEPLQHPPGTQTGRLKDPAVQALLRELAIKNNGLCVVTTRLAVADVAGRAGTVEADLEDLPSEAGAALLKQSASRARTTNYEKRPTSSADTPWR